MEDDIENLPDAVLLALPEAQVSPGSLTLLWARKADTLRQRDLKELSDELNGLSRSRRMLAPGQTDEAELRRRRELKAREDDLLRRINIEQQRILVEMEELDRRTIRLHDGRRTYVDGKDYRDEQGRVLHGADRDEAEAQHRQNPNAATWAEKQEIEARAQEAQALKDKVVRDGEGPMTENEQRFKGYEKELADKIDARVKEPPVDYGSADYMSVDNWRISSAAAFAVAAEPVSRETIGKLTKDNNASPLTDMKKPPQPGGGSGIKPI
jgi:hypothetical protein